MLFLLVYSHLPTFTSEGHKSSCLFLVRFEVVINDGIQNVPASVEFIDITV